MKRDITITRHSFIGHMTGETQRGVEFLSKCIGAKRNPFMPIGFRFGIMRDLDMATIAAVKAGLNVGSDQAND